LKKNDLNLQFYEKNIVKIKNPKNLNFGLFQILDFQKKVKPQKTTFSSPAV